MRVTNLTCWLQPSMLLSKRFASLPRAITSSSKRMMASSIWSPRLRLSTWTYSTKQTSKTSHLSSDPVWKIRIQHMINTKDNYTLSKIWDLIMIATTWEVKRLIETARALQSTLISEVRTPSTLTTEMQTGLSPSPKKSILAIPLSMQTKAPKILRNGSSLIAKWKRDQTSAWKYLTEKIAKIEVHSPKTISTRRSSKRNMYQFQNSSL